ncbi:MAG: polysaccharide deacetylase family protein [Patescibacteria group bacterium]
MSITFAKQSASTVTVTIHFSLPLLSRSKLLLLLFVCFFSILLFVIPAKAGIYLSGFLVKPGMTALHIPPFPFAQHALIVEKKEANIPVIQKKENHPVFVSHGSREKKEIALTFDADMTYGMQEMLTNGEVPTLYDDRLISLLEETDTKATLFLAGLWIETYPEEAKNLAANPLFELASHSYSHPSFDGDCFGLGEIPDEQNDEELSKTQALLKELTGIENTLFRFPGGCYSENDLASLKKFTLTAIQWDVAGKDGFNDDAQSIKNAILDQVQNGSIIVLHMNGGTNEPETTNVVAEIIPLLREQGYHFVTVSELNN